MNHRRPGRGGRQPRQSVHNETSATAELRKEIGEPDERSIKGTKLLTWCHARGNGMLLGRLSGQEIHEGETVMGQVHAMRRLCQDLKLRPRYTVLTLNNSGGRRYEERPDFLLLEERIREGEIDWICVRDLDRLIRDDLARATLFDLLRRTGVKLYIASWGRAADWTHDKMALQALGMASEHERDMTRERTRTAVITRFVAEGRGHPGSQRFGFYRDPMTKDLRVDKEQWPFAKLIHLRYDELGGKGRGIRQVQEELAAMGCEFTESHISNILKDPIYVTGEWKTTVDGVLITCKPVELDDPVPADVFQRNQERLAAHRGPNSVVPVGFFCLNGVPIVHAACEDERVPNGKGQTVQPLLRGRSYGKRKVVPRYMHRPAVPEQCRGWTIDADVLESAVIREILRLAGSRELQREWATREVLRRQQDERPLLGQEQRREVEARIERLEAHKETLERDLLARLEAGEDVGNEDHRGLVGPIERELGRLHRQLEVADKVPRRVEGSSAGTGDPVLAALAEEVGLGEEDELSLLEALAEVLTEERPSDEDHLRRRAAVIQACLSVIVIHDLEEGVVGIELRGPLVPEGARLTRPLSPIDSARDSLMARMREAEAIPA